MSKFNEHGIPYSFEEFVDILEDQRANDNRFFPELKKVFQNLNKVKESDDKKTPLFDICLRDSKIEQGKEFVINNKELLNKIEKIYAVDPFTITAVLMIESDFCTITGDYRIFNVFLSQILFLYDIARDVYGEQIDERINKKITRKIESAIDNLVVFLKTCKQRGIDPLDILGSSAGAIGCPQFMPSSFIYAVDGNNDGKIDLYNIEDAMFSIANYLVNHGYETDRDKAILRYNADKEFLECINQYSQKLKEVINISEIK